MRDHVALCYVALVSGVVALFVAGFGSWNGWVQLGAIGALAVVCTRLLAPIYFGWREPEDYERR
jgi:membrane protein implicated in regulation of membrane protease activity